MKKIWFFLILGGLVFFVVSCAKPTPAPAPVPAPAPAAEEITEPGETGKEMEIKVTEEGVKYIVDPGKIVGGGPPKDGIPSIDNPKFVSVAEADDWIQDNELVLAFTYKDVTRVYPLQIMVWHEMVNDIIAGDPILITY